MQTTAVVIGAGQSGLAKSHRLTERSVDHVVLECGEVANSWRTQRWPTLRLLTPNWQTRLPGHGYGGDDPDGYLPVAEVVATLTRYARLIGAPVHTGATVHAVRTGPEGFEVHANDEVCRARAVVLATGACNLPAIPDAGRAPAAPLRTHPRRPPIAPGAGPGHRGDRHGAVGDRIPAQPLLARHPRV